VSPEPLNEPLGEPLPYGHSADGVVSYSADSTKFRKAEEKRSGEEERKSPSLVPSPVQTVREISEADCYAACRRWFPGDEAQVARALGNGSAREVMESLEDAHQGGWALRESLYWLFQNYGGQ
jgi:hypothetical protein